MASGAARRRLPQAGLPRDAPQFPARSLQPRRRSLRVLRRGHQHGSRRARALGLHGRRGGHEKTFGELKQHLAFDAIPGRDRQANALWQQFSVRTHNLVRSFQLCLGAPARPRSRKRTFGFVCRSLQTLRFMRFDQPARIVRPGGRPELRFAVSPVTRQAIEQAARSIQRAA